LEKNYEKIIAQFVKYKKEIKNDLTLIDTNRQSRFIINRMFKLDSNIKRDLEPIDIVYMRLFLMQHIKIVSYPKKSFLINFVQV